MIWHTTVVRQLRESGLFSDVQLQGGKVRATLDAARFLDIHYDPSSGSYSYALINLTLHFPGDRREFGWDDYPHPGNERLQALPGFPHHFQERLPDGSWHFTESPFRGQIERDMLIVLKYLKQFLQKERPGSTS